MSNRQLEEHRERLHAEAVAAGLGISIDQLNLLEWRDEPNMSDEGVLYGHDIYFDEGSDPDVLKKLGSAIGEFIRIGPMSDSPEV